VASLGVAAVSYVACGGSTETNNPVGNLMGYPDDAQNDSPASDAKNDSPVGDAKNDSPEDATLDQLVANLVAPPEDASDATGN
jgi:hypothetical protein